MIRPLLASVLLSAAFSAAAQNTPAANFTDMWWNPSESGWGLNITQHAATNKAFVVWYTYDPREPETATPEASDYKPLWMVLPNSTWTSPTTLTGAVYVTRGSPYFQGWNPAAHGAQEVGTFTFQFSGLSDGTFTWNIVPPGGLASTNPAFGLPSFSGTRAITRQSF